MNIKDKYSDYKERKEARAFFNRHNNEKIYGKDYLIAIAVGVIVTFVLGMIMEWIIAGTGFNFSYFSIVVGILQARAIRKILNKSGEKLAVISAVTFVLGILFAQTIHACIILPYFNIQILIDMFVFCIRYMFVGDFLNTIIYLFGAIASYMALKD